METTRLLRLGTRRVLAGLLTTHSLYIFQSLPPGVGVHSRLNLILSITVAHKHPAAASHPPWPTRSRFHSLRGERDHEDRPYRMVRLKR
jgi:hypothetical protein